MAGLIFYLTPFRQAQGPEPAAGQRRRDAGPASLLYAVTGPASLLYAVTGPASLLYAVTGATGCFAGEGSHKGSKLTKDWEAVDRGCEMFTGTEMTVVIPLRLF